MARGVLVQLSLAGLVAGATLSFSSFLNAQASDSWLLSESGATGDADLKLDTAAAQRALGADQSSLDAQKRMTRAMGVLIRSYPGRNRLFDASEAPAGAVDVTVPFLDLIQLGRAESPSTARASSPRPVDEIIVGGPIKGVPGATWADANMDGQVDGFVYEGQYYALSDRRGTASAPTAEHALQAEQIDLPHDQVGSGVEGEEQANTDQEDWKSQVFEQVQALIGKVIDRDSERDIGAMERDPSTAREEGESAASHALGSRPATAAEGQSWRQELLPRSAQQHGDQQAEQAVPVSERPVNPTRRVLPPGALSDSFARRGPPAGTQQTTISAPGRQPRATPAQTTALPPRRPSYDNSSRTSVLPPRRISPAMPQQAAQPAAGRSQPPSPQQATPSPFRRPQPALPQEATPAPIGRTQPAIPQQALPSLPRPHPPAVARKVTPKSEQQDACNPLLGLPCPE